MAATDAGLVIDHDYLAYGPPRDQHPYDRHEHYPYRTTMERIETHDANRHVDANGNAQLFNTITGEMRLIPAPTNDPRDPLNLPKWHKILGLACLCCFGALAAAAELVLGAMVYIFVLVYADIDVHWIVVFTNFGGMSMVKNPLKLLENMNPRIPIWKIYLLASLPVLFMGIANFFFVPLAIGIGRRPVILGCGILAIAGACWAGASQSLGSHLAARCLQALGAGTVESLIPFIIQDMVFVHQRNTAISVVFAIQGLLIVALGFGVPYIIIYQSWRLLYFVTAGGAGFFLIGVFLFVPETRWHRTRDELNGIKAADKFPLGVHFNSEFSLFTTSSGTSLRKKDSIASKAWKGFVSTTVFGEKDEDLNPNDPDDLWRMQSKERKEQRRLEKLAKGGIPNYKYKADPRYPPRTWKYDWKLFHGTRDWQAMWTAIVITLRTFFYPHIFFITMLNSAMIAAMFAVGYTVAPALIEPPYSWKFFNIGFCLIPLIIAAVCVGLLTGWTADKIVNMAARRRGRRVPEDQILNLILPTICGLVGLLLYGLCGSYPYKYGWPLMLLGLGLMTFGFLGANTIGAVYVLESYPHLAGPALVNIASFRCIIAFILSFRVSEWVADFGYLKTSIIFIAIIGVFSMFLPIIYFKGQAWRKRWPADWAHETGVSF